MSEAKPMDCGNSPCFFAVPPLQGVRTRGSCRCMRHLAPELSPSRQREVGDVIRETIAAHVIAAIHREAIREEAERVMARQDATFRKLADEGGTEPCTACGHPERLHRSNGCLDFDCSCQEMHR